MAVFKQDLEAGRVHQMGGWRGEQERLRERPKRSKAGRLCVQGEEGVASQGRGGEVG